MSSRSPSDAQAACSAADGRMYVVDTSVQQALRQAAVLIREVIPRAQRVDATVTVAGHSHSVTIPDDNDQGSAEIRSRLSLPLADDNGPIGSLDCSSVASAAFSADDERAGRAFAAVASASLVNVAACCDARRESEQVLRALESRASIEQAKGILMATTHCPPDEAFLILVHASQRENRKLRDIADQIVRNASEAAALGGPRRLSRPPIGTGATPRA